MDYIVRAVDKDKEVRIFAITSREFITLALLLRLHLEDSCQQAP